MKIKGIELGRSPIIAGVVAGELSPRQIRKAVTLGARLLEIRIDAFKKRDISSLRDYLSAIKKTKGLSRVPLILTVRSKTEGGVAEIKDKDRSQILDSLMPYADLVDIELGSSAILREAILRAKRAGKRVILSRHDFRRTPAEAELRRTINDARAKGADIVKIACLAKETGDIKRLARLLFEFNDMIVIAMGRLGRGSRVIFPAMGSLITYGSISDKTAPGQGSVAELNEMFARLGLKP